MRFRLTKLCLLPRFDKTESCRCLRSLGISEEDGNSLLTDLPMLCYVRRIFCHGGENVSRLWMCCVSLNIRVEACLF